MQYVSTRDNTLHVTAAQAIATGLSADGGLFTPEKLPHIDPVFINKLTGFSYAERSVEIMSLFLDEFSRDELLSFAQSAYGAQKFPQGNAAPVKTLDTGLHVLELWHGPTCAFKDLALQMLPHLLTASLKKNNEQRRACILVATSGDTGKAALEGFCDVEGTNILVFYPQDGVSDIQRLQMTTQRGGNVGVCAVRGNFDDAQTGVKAIFSDTALRARMDQAGYFFSSANSINWGRVLPQIVYYFSAYCDLVAQGRLRQGDTMNVCVPTGNFGNILAAYYAMRMGLPVGKLICASNRNSVLTDFINTGVYNARRPFYGTLSPSMDILISSNLERLLFDFSGQDSEQIRTLMNSLKENGSYAVSDSVNNTLKSTFYAGCCDDEQTQKTIASVFTGCGYLLDPHTAVAFDVYDRYKKETGDTAPTLIVSTASPYKFCKGVLSALGEDTQGRSDAELIDKLEEVSGVPAAQPLKAVRTLSQRFSQVVERDAMLGYVTKTLGI